MPGNFKMRISREVVNLQAIHAALSKGQRTALMIRHAERPHIRPDDASFGRTLGLTPFGITTARAAGEKLRGISDVSFFASPMTRCQMTARLFAEGMGFDDPLVQDAEELGVRGFYYEDDLAVQKLMQEQGYMAFMLEYLRNGTAPYSRPVKQATDQMVQWLQTKATTLLGVYVSHDIFVAAFLTGLNAATFTAENWVGFLHGAVLSQTADGVWACNPFMPEFATKSSTPQ